jgi:hypothetical protein
MQCFTGANIRKIIGATSTAALHCVGADIHVRANGMIADMLFAAVCARCRLLRAGSRPPITTRHWAWPWGRQRQTSASESQAAAASQWWPHHVGWLLIRGGYCAGNTCYQ